MQQLYHESRKPFKCSRYPDRGIDFDEDVLCSMDVDLELPGFVDR